MKKVLLIVMVMILASASVLALTACSKPEGVYKFESVNVVVGVTSVTYSVGDDKGSDGTFTENSAVLTLNKDGTYEFVDHTFLDTKRTGTWEIVKYDDGSKQIRFDENNDLLADFNKKGLTFYYSGYYISYTYKLAKQ